MFNISESTKITGLEKTGCKISHIQHCLNVNSMHSKPVYTYYGKHVSKGTVVIHTKNGDFTIRFDEKNNWARELEIF